MAERITMSETFFKPISKPDSGDNRLNGTNIEKTLEDISVFNNKPKPDKI